MFSGTGFGQAQAPKTTATTGFTFGQPAATGTTFGQPGATGTTFGQPAATGTTFGQPAATGSLFGQSAQPATSQPAAGFTGFSFPSSTSASQPGGGFQLTSSSAAPNVSLFSSTLQNKTPTATGFGLPQTTAAAQPAATGFGLPQTSAAQPAPTFGFSAPKTSAPAAATTAATGFSFGFGQTNAASTAPTLSLGLGTAAATTAAPALGTATTTQQQLPTLGFNLGTPATTSTATGLTFGLGATTAAATTSAPTLSFGLGSTLTSAPSFGLTTTTTAAATTTSAPATSLGLGGTTSFNLGKGTSLATQPDQLKVNPLTSLTPAPNQSKAPNYKDELIPPEMMSLIESFKAFVKEQKSSSSVVNRASLKQITKVTEDAELLKRMTMQLERNVNKNKALNRKLREDVARGIQDSEIVHRLSLDPREFPINNSVAFEYFRNIVDRFQLQVESLTVELKNMEKHIVCKLSPSPFTPEELSAVMKQLYECFVALAGRYQTIHSSVTSLKLDMQRKNDPWYALNSGRTSALN